MMLCSERETTIMAYADGELELTAALEIEAHMNSCAVCTDIYRAIKQVKLVASDQRLRYPMPSGLEARMLSAIHQDEVEPPPTAIIPVFRLPRIMATAAAFLLVGIVLGRLTIVGQRSLTAAADYTIEGQVVGSHIRSLMASHLYDVVSTDQHTVKPWFAGKLDFSPPVTNFANVGFPLIGGRLDYIGARTAAAIVYRHKKHTINLFAWPDPTAPSNPVADADEQGYHVVHWNQAGMSLWLVSDMDENGLVGFARTVKQSISPG